MTCRCREVVRCPILDLEDLKQLLDQLAVAGGRDDRIPAIAELPQADAAVVVHRQTNDAFQRSRPGIVERDLDVGRNILAVVRDRQLQLNPSPEESTSSRTENHRLTRRIAAGASLATTIG